MLTIAKIKKLKMAKIEKQKIAAQSVQNKDYSRYKFKFDVGALKAEDTEVILILLSVAQLIDCDDIKGQIKEAIENDELKDWILLDILIESDFTFFNKATKAKTFKNIVRMDEKDLVDAFTKIADQISY